MTYGDFGRGAGLWAIQADSSGAPSLARYIAGADDQPGRSDIARRGSDWVLAFTGSGARVARYPDDGSLTQGPVLTFNGQTTPNVAWIRIAARGEASGVVWQVEPNLLRWARLNADLVATDGVSVGATGYRPDIVATETGYAMAWAVGSGVGFMRASTAGAMLCERGVVPLGLDQASDSHRVALADSALGTLALVTSAVGKVVLVRFGFDCEPVIVPVANTRSAGSPAIAVGNGSVAMAWADTTTGNPIGYTRLVGEYLCE